MRRKTTGIILTAFTFCVLAIQPLSAQNTRNITLKEAIDLSIKNSKQLKSRQAQIQQAVAATQEAIERRLPEAGVSGSYLRLNNPNVSLKVQKTDTTRGSGAGSQTQAGGKVSQAMYGMANVS